MRPVVAMGALAAFLAAGAPAPSRVEAHSPGASVPDEFIQGAFTPAFVPPEAGTYELPPITRVSGFMLRAGHAVDTGTLMAGKTRW